MNEKILKETGQRVFRQGKSTLIWNAPNRTLSERLAALEELESGSPDDELRKQIKERLEYEAAAIKALKENPNGKFVYVIEDNERNYSCGFFR